VTWWRLSQ